jgi:hypothetical protein
MERGVAEDLAVADREPATIDVAKPRGGLYQSVEHCRKIEGRAADDLEHVGGRRPLRQRLVALAFELGNLTQAGRG